ncbi:3'(2'),5'-bisphosphate nucleotidase CysQ [Sneathiella sp. P13V-1]|uniref:3'(2'),5'-bisphosphate nucleotidase CysQ n=1 Tax=Sneathiella sp. P13V-1 TaxID=2697366 RepID=UPI00187B714B|nr:3'(2'),5'-bisphosphate nucleotidase CysQ [Sneathiella sp. P13V-1]MBE7638548.1 3'(2'),5'-bisphosphate nucleotidase CysQ [Sneathiella sp. P13V-1]
MDRQAVTDAIVKIARDAGDKILEIYNRDFEIDTKSDESPVTEADVAAEKIILEGLSKVTPDIPVLAEESVAAGRVPDLSGGTFWLVDPLDGTKEFIHKRGEFTVNIALVENGRPTMGVIHVPAKDTIYYAFGKGEAYMEDEGGKRAIQTREAPAEGLTVVASRSHRTPETDDYISKFKVADLVSAGSSLKLCLVAEGKADLYPRLGRTMEWDIGAGQAILEAAGGVVETLDGAPLGYGKDGHDNPYFVAKGRA